MRKLFLLLSPIILIFITNTSHSQTQGVLGKRFFDNWSIGVSAGPNVFFGDLKVHKFWPATENMNEWRAAGSFYLIKQFTHVFALRGQIIYGQIAGTKRLYTNGATCNQYFEGSLAEPNLNLIINFMNIFGYKPERRFFLYGTVGIGMAFWHTQKYDLVTRAKIGEAGKNFPDWTKEAVIPAGLGAWYSIGDKVNLGLEWTLHAVNSDRLDATVGGYKYDMFSFLSFNVTFNFNKPNPGKLKSANMGKNMGPVPPKQNLPELKPMSKPEQKDLYQQRPALQPPVKKDSMIIKKPELKNEDAAGQITEGIGVNGETGADIQSGPVMQGISYRVQVFAFKTDEYTAEAIRAKFHVRQPVYKEFTEGWYRFTTGSFKSLKTAQSLMHQLRNKNGVKDAFVAKYKDGVRTPTNPKP